MKKILLCFSLLLSMGGFSQNKAILYNFTPQPQSLLLNPGADLKYKWFFGIPLFSGISANAGSTGFDAFSLFSKNEIDFTSKVKILLNTVSKNDYVTANQQLEIVSGGFRIGGMDHPAYLSFGLYQEMDSFFFIPKGPALLAVYGNNNFIGQYFDLNELSARAELINVFHIGFNKQLHKNLIVGGRAKLYSSIANATATRNSGYFYTVQGQDLVYDQFIKSNIRLNTSGMAKYLEDDYDGDLATDLRNDLPQKAFFGGNYGMGIDLGLTYYPEKNIQFTASLLDLGFIKHSKDVYDYTFIGEYTFKGLFNPFNSSGTPQNAYEDFKKAIPLVTVYDSYTTWRPLKFYTSFQYSFEQEVQQDCDCETDEASWYRSGAGLQFFSMATPRAPMAALTAYYRRRILKELQVKAAYTIDSYSYTNIGLGISSKIGKFNMYAMADNLLAYRDVSKANALSFQVGFNIISGGSSK